MYPRGAAIYPNGTENDSDDAPMHPNGTLMSPNHGGGDPTAAPVDHEAMRRMRAQSKFFDYGIPRTLNPTPWTLNLTLPTPKPYTLNPEP